MNTSDKRGDWMIRKLAADRKFFEDAKAARDIRECSTSNPDPRPLVYRLRVEHDDEFKLIGDYSTREEAEEHLSAELARRAGRKYMITPLVVR